MIEGFCILGLFLILLLGMIFILAFSPDQKDQDLSPEDIVILGYKNKRS